MKTPSPKIDWTRAKDLLAGMRSHSRRRLASQILLGKEIRQIKQNAGIYGPGGDRRSKVQVGPLKSEERAWNGLCRQGLGISRQTANRYITRFEKAAEFARTLPKAGNILLVPTAELAGDEVEKLADFVEKLVDQMTQAALLIELGLKIEADDEKQSDDQETAGQDLKIDLPKEAQIFFASITRKIADFKNSICGSREYRKYKIFLEHLPLDDGRDGKPSLIGIKEGLEDAIKEGLSGILDELEETIVGKLHGKPLKRARKKSLTHSRK